MNEFTSINEKEVEKLKRRIRKAIEDAPSLSGEALMHFVICRALKGHSWSITIDGMTAHN